ncbi:MAG TPA: Rrf2 family transcriptional regulator [Oscillatoriales cyanobacterium M59_W2019_021]|nr:Rrf2 family transcriptional regulator [Oscillatoriales cyanobacterium M4454_W2019_049]HIK51186.1 Rrf2 family transcriptional regulator [Oscillatoriales cyanobacterium M59_W2019_021]
MVVVELSCKSEYAILALLELASCHRCGEPLQIRQIAARQQIPDRYLEQLLATLRRGGLVRSQRGAKGGYLLAREPATIALLEVVECIEGLKTPGAENNRQANTIECAIVRGTWQEVRQAARAVLQKYTLQDLKERRDSQQQHNLMYYI